VQPLDPSGDYTDAEVINELTGYRGTRSLSFRYDRLNELNNYVEPLDWVEACTVSNNALADIKRVATLTMLDRGGINFLKDRVRPWARLAMPLDPLFYGPGGIVRTNLCTNPSFETDITGWSAYAAGTGATAARSIAASQVGAASLRIEAGTSAGTYSGATFNTASLPAGTYTMSAWVKLSTAYGNGIQARVIAPDGSQTFGALSTVIGTWQRVSWTYTSTTAGIHRLYFVTYASAPASGSVFYLDAVMLEQSAVLNDYIDGDTADNAVEGGSFFEWNGTPNASTSSERESIVLPPLRSGFVEWPLGVFLLSTPERVLGSDGVVRREVEAYDQLLALQQDRVVDRYTIAGGAAYTDAINTLVFAFSASVTPSTLTLPSALEWEPGTTKLRILNDLLDAINYESAFFDEVGTLICRPYQSPTSRSAEYTYQANEASVITGDIGQTLDLFDIPNSWVLVKSEPDLPPLVGTYTNDNPLSPTSTVSRGRVIVDFRTETDAADQTTIDAKAERLAFSASQIFENIEFSTALMPMHSNADVVGLAIPGLAIDAKYSEHTWDMPLEAGAKMTHTVRRVVSI